MNTIEYITKQQAIDAILNDKVELTEEIKAIGSTELFKTLNMTCDRHVKMLRELPSAEPSLQDWQKIVLSNLNQCQSSDLISRQAAIDAIHREADRLESGGAIPHGQGARGMAFVIGLLPSAEPQIIRCKDCIYYDPPHIENNGKRYEYKDMPNEAFDPYEVGVSVEYGINVGGRCCVDHETGYAEDKRVFVSKDNYCGRAERMGVDNESR